MNLQVPASWGCESFGSWPLAAHRILSCCFHLIAATRLDWQPGAGEDSDPGMRSLFSETLRRREPTYLRSRKTGTPQPEAYFNLQSPVNQVSCFRIWKFPQTTCEYETWVWGFYSVQFCIYEFLASFSISLFLPSFSPSFCLCYLIVFYVSLKTGSQSPCLWFSIFVSLCLSRW